MHPKIHTLRHHHTTEKLGCTQNLLQSNQFHNNPYEPLQNLSREQEKKNIILKHKRLNHSLIAWSISVLMKNNRCRVMELPYLVLWLTISMRGLYISAYTILVPGLWRPLRLVFSIWLISLARELRFPIHSRLEIGFFELMVMIAGKHPIGGIPTTPIFIAPSSNRSCNS